MLSEFLVYLRLGFEHITDVRGYDHILFVAVLTASYLGQWRRLFWLVTAFTVGHSVTLALATLDLLRVSPSLVELLIPSTILATSLVNIWDREPTEAPTDRTRAAFLKYAIAVAFGLVHGMGFSNFLRAALGSEESIFVPLLAFNIGLEFGQLAIVAGLVALAAVFVKWLGLSKRAWVLTVSTICGVSALVMIVQRAP